MLVRWCNVHIVGKHGAFHDIEWNETLRIELATTDWTVASLRLAYSQGCSDAFVTKEVPASSSSEIGRVVKTYDTFQMVQSWIFCLLCPRRFYERFWL